MRAMLSLACIAASAVASPIAQAQQGANTATLSSTLGSTFLVETTSPEAMKALVTQLSAETGHVVEATKLEGAETKNEEAIEAQPAAQASTTTQAKFSWIGLSAHIEGGTRIFNGGGGVTFINGLFEVAGDIGIPSYGYSLTVAPLAPIFRDLKVQPTVTRKYFVQGDLQGEQKRNTTTNAKFLYGVQVYPWGTKKWGFYAQGGRGDVSTEYWVGPPPGGTRRVIETQTAKRTVVIVGGRKSW